MVSILKTSQMKYFKILQPGDFLAPCSKRVRQVDSHTTDQEKVLTEDEGGWVDTHFYAGSFGLKVRKYHEAFWC